jgi:serine/threonine protein kinase
VKRIKQYPSPSSLALIGWMREHQVKEQEFLIGRPYNCVGIPLVLYNSIFSDFKRDYENEELTMNKEHYQWTFKMIKLMADFYANENCRQQKFHKRIRKLLGKDVNVVQLDDKTSNDGVLTLDFHSFTVLLGLTEIKNEIGTGKCDPTTQAAVSYAKFYTQQKYNKLLKGCNLPCFIIALTGPWICVLGAVYVEKPVIEPLTAFEPLIFTNDKTHVEKIARLFRALRLGSDNLKNYYNSLPYTTLNNADPQRFCPYLHKADNVGEFFYTNKLFDDKLLWKAETKEGGQQIVVKYTRRYNKDAHKLCSEIRKAPRLLHVDMMTCGFYYVVMEYVEGQRLCDCDDLKYSVYDKIIKDVEEAVLLLHSNNIVFADLRDSNILVIRDENEEYHGVLVDFDWAGMNNVDSYPSFMNPDINWPAGAQDKMLLKKEHDMYLLNCLKEVYLGQYIKKLE